MFDIGWSEMLLVAVVAIVVIGPKDLPHAMRTVGQWVGNLRRAADGFRRQFDDMVRESELDELRKQANSIARLDYGPADDPRYDPTGTARPAEAEPPAPSSVLPPPGEPVEPPPERRTDAAAGPAQPQAAMPPTPGSAA